MRYKLLFLLILVLPIVYSIEIKTFVNDYAGIINAEEEQQLNAILEQIYNSGEAQYSIVTVSSLEGKDINSYSLELAQGELGDKEKNNGILLLVSLEDRKYKFEVGRGIEHILNDAKIGRIGRTYLVPNFKEENYGNGIIGASLAVKSILLGDKESVYYVDERSGNIEGNIYLAFLIFFFVLMPLLAVIFKRYKSKNRYFEAAAAAIIIFGGRGRGSGGFGGGGFGGFGGGGFGGGGAGGSW